MKHIFFVESYFHVLVVDLIIKSKKLPYDSVFFITERGTVLPDFYKDKLIYDGTVVSLLKRVLFYYKNIFIFNKKFSCSEICAYLPFQFAFPSKLYFKQYVFFEEGFSAYSKKPLPVDCPPKTHGLIKKLAVSLLLPFANDNVKGIVSGITCDSNKAFNTSILRLSDKAYGGLIRLEQIHLETLDINNCNPFYESSIKDSFIVVLDRLSANGRPFNDNTYLAVLSKTIRNVYKTIKKMYIKMHPADLNNAGFAKRVLDLLNIYSPVLINENLENLSICNNRNTFLGTNSTVLYYAPILGNTNKSISFARQLAAEDQLYNEFLGNWGGVDSFCKLFGEQVECM